MPISSQYCSKKPLFMHMICVLASFTWLAMVAATRLLEVPNCTAIEKIYLLFADANFVTSGLGISVLIAFADLSVDSIIKLNKITCLKQVVI